MRFPKKIVFTVFIVCFFSVLICKGQLRGSLVNYIVENNQIDFLNFSINYRLIFYEERPTIKLKYSYNLRKTDTESYDIPFQLKLHLSKKKDGPFYIIPLPVQTLKTDNQSHSLIFSPVWGELLYHQDKDTPLDSERAQVILRSDSIKVNRFQVDILADNR